MALRITDELSSPSMLTPRRQLGLFGFGINPGFYMDDAAGLCTGIACFCQCSPGAVGTVSNRIAAGCADVKDLRMYRLNSGSNMKQNRSSVFVSGFVNKILISGWQSDSGSL